MSGMFQDKKINGLRMFLFHNFGMAPYATEEFLAWCKNTFGETQSIDSLVYYGQNNICAVSDPTEEEASIIEFLNNLPITNPASWFGCFKDHFKCLSANINLNYFRGKRWEYFVLARENSGSAFEIRAIYFANDEDAILFKLRWS